jgi:microcystin-dependent protein
MAGKIVQRRRGTTAEHTGFIGAVGEFTYDTTKKTVVAHDGATAGGVPLAQESSSVNLAVRKTLPTYTYEDVSTSLVNDQEVAIIQVRQNDSSEVGVSAKIRALSDGVVGKLKWVISVGLPSVLVNVLTIRDTGIDIIGAVSASGRFSGLGILPIGTVIDFAGVAAPTGFLLCFGQNVSRTTYASLFAVIGTTYGVGDGSTTFTLPDLRGRAIAGKDDMGGVSANRLTGLAGGVNGDVLGATGGEEAHILTAAQVPVLDLTTGTGSGATPRAQSFLASGSTQLSLQVNAGGGGAHNTIQPTFILNKAIYAGV